MMNSISNKGNLVDVTHAKKMVMPIKKVKMTGPIKAGPEGYKEMLERGLRYLEAAFESSFKKANHGVSKTQMAEGIKKYGSIEQYKQAEWTPEKVSGRILDFALSGFDKWWKQNDDLSHNDAVDQYAVMIEKAVQTGYDGAMEVLVDIPDEVRAELEQTLTLTKQGIQAWREHQLQPQDSQVPA